MGPTSSNRAKRIVVAITGASGVIYGVRLLEVLKSQGIESHLILSEQGRKVISLETTFTVDRVEALAHTVHNPTDLTAPLSSGSFPVDAMVVLPCSMKTLSAIANSHADNLITRATDVALKERRRLILSVRETPLHLGHLRLMTNVTEMGAIILPPIPGFYHGPTTVEEIIDHTVGKVCDLLEVEHELYRRWS